MQTQNVRKMAKQFEDRYIMFTTVKVQLMLITLFNMFISLLFFCSIIELSRVLKNKVFLVHL